MLLWHEPGRASTSRALTQVVPISPFSDEKGAAMVPEPAQAAKNEGRSPAGRRSAMFQADLEAIRANVCAASTEDLLDRVTAYRSGMEPEAVELIEEELRRRGVTAAQQIDHATAHIGVLVDAQGLALRCQRCARPAVWRGLRWHWLWGMLPLFPRRMILCAAHAGLPAVPAGAARPAALPPPQQDGITAPPGFSPRRPAE
jgi:hypothetical protein